MKTNKLENRLTYFILTYALFLLNINNISILSILIGSIISLLFILLIKNIKINNIFISILSIPILIYYLNKISYYIGDNILKEYSIIIITLTLLLSIFILGNKGYHTIIKVIILSTYFILFISIIGIFLTIPYININNLNINILNTNNLLNNTLLSTFIFTYSYLLIYPITNTNFKNKDLIITSIFHILKYISIYSILGLLINYLKYPYITIFKKVNLLNFIERIEILFSLNYLFIFYFLLVLIYYQIFNVLKNKINKKKYLNITLIFLYFFIFLLSMLF